MSSLMSVDGFGHKTGVLTRGVLNVNETYHWINSDSCSLGHRLIVVGVNLSKDLEETLPKCYEAIFSEFERSKKSGSLGDRIVIPTIGTTFTRTDWGVVSLEQSAKVAMAAAKKFITLHPDDQVLFGFTACEQERKAFWAYMCEYTLLLEESPKIAKQIDLKVDLNGVLALTMDGDALACPSSPAFYETLKNWNRQTKESPKSSKTEQQSGTELEPM